MEEHDFDSLVLKELSGEASPEESHLLQETIRDHADLRKKYEEWRETWGALKTAGALTGVLHARTPELPAYRLAELKDAVRAAFPRQEQSRRISPWLTWLKPGWTTLGGVAAVFILCLFFIPWRGGGIVELGMEETSAVRGGGEAMDLSRLSNCVLLQFHNENEFENWRKGPLTRRQKAKAWIEEETETLHVIQRDPNGKPSETIHPLPENPAERRRQLEKILGTLK